MSQKWTKIQDNIPRNEDILFMTGDGKVHIGLVLGDEKIRKCVFIDFNQSEKKYYDSDTSTSYADRVIFWSELPEIDNTKD